MDFDVFWNIVANHGRVAHLYRTECEQRWTTFTDEQQQAICDTIRQKLQSGRFVHYNPANAMVDNAPRPPKKQVLTMSQYYDCFHTTDLQPGWHTENPTGQQVIYVKNS